MSRPKWQPSTISRTAVVSPNHSFNAQPMRGPNRQKQNRPVAIQRQASVAAHQDQPDCLSASLESCPKTMSDNLLHDLGCDCLQRTGQESCAGALRGAAFRRQGDLGRMVPRNGSHSNDGTYPWAGRVVIPAGAEAT